MMILKNIKLNKNRGFVLLFAMMLSSIILVIAIGVMNIALNETKFSVSAKNTNEAFFAADTGAECALYNDLTLNAFAEDGEVEMLCSGLNVVSANYVSGSYFWVFSITGLGNGGQSCSNVTVLKDGGVTTIRSQGYNNCNFSGSNQVERELVITY